MRSVGIMVLFPPVSQDMVGYRTYNPSYYQITENMSRCRLTYKKAVVYGLYGLSTVLFT